MLVYQVERNHVMVPLEYCIRKGDLLFIPPGRLTPCRWPRLTYVQQQRFVMKRHVTRQVLRLQSQGLTTAVIAERLGLKMQLVRQVLATDRQLRQRFADYWASRDFR